MKLLRIYLVLVLVLLFVLLCTIVSVALFVRIVQVSLDSPPWPGTASASASASPGMVDDVSEQRTSVEQGTGTDKSNGGTDIISKVNRGTKDAVKVNRRTEDKVNQDLRENMIRQLEEKEEEIRFLVQQRDRLRKDLARLRNQIQHLSININGSAENRTENETSDENSDDNIDDDNAADTHDEDQFLNASLRHHVSSGNSSAPQERLTSIDDEDRRTMKSGRPLDAGRKEDRSSAEGVRFTNEHEVVPYTRFTLTRIYVLESGLEPRVVEKPTGHRKKAIDAVIDEALDRLNERRSKTSQFVREDFLEGIFRSVPGFGEQYDLYFADKELPRYVQMSMERLLAAPVVATRRTVQIRKDFIYMVVPLSGRIDKFRKFVERFIQVAIIGDNKVHLMVVYFGREGLSEVQDVLRKTSSDHHYPHMSVLALDGKFSRGRALREGVKRCPFPGDGLMFFCDVDIVVTTDFLERCRLNTDKGRRVYYPIVFSLYNPRLVSSLQARSLLDTAAAAAAPTAAGTAANDTVVLSAETGFWRDFGYGMTCQYRSDFERLDGFSEAIQGWGLEDVLLYRRYLRSEMAVVRATDPGIVHLWHEKNCDLSLPGDQYRSCIRSKALNEASHAQLGMLAFAADIDLNRNLTKKRRA